jgi:hypothetical protein
MISLFTVASQDQSLTYLAQLFGSVGTVLVPNANAAITFGIMGMIFKSLNTTALILGAILVTQTTIVGLLKTATEGEFLGKQWSSLWVPFRMVLGISTLFPTAAGYSVLQIVLMWVIIQGVGAADSLWTVVLNYVNVFGSPYSTVSLPTTIDVTQNLKTLFADLTCETTAKANYALSYPDTNTGSQHNFYYCADNASSNFCQYDTLAATVANNAGGAAAATSQTVSNPTALFNASQTEQGGGQRVCTNSVTNGTVCTFGPNGACGSMTFGNPTGVCPGGQDIGSQLQCVGYKAQGAALTWIIDLFYNAASDLTLYDFSYLLFYNNTLLAPSSSQTPQWLQNYCQTKGLSQNQCCYVFNPNGQFTNCKSGSDTTFPNANGPNSDYTSAGPEAISQIIWPCAIESIVSGAGVGSTTCVQTPPSNADFISASTTYYKNTINGAIATAMSAYLSNQSNLPQGSWESTAQQLGWLLAGSYYYQIASTNNSNLKLSLPPFSVLAADFSGQNGPNPLANYRNNVTAAGNLLNQVSALSSNPSSPAASVPTLAAAGSSMNGLAADVMSSFEGALTGGGSNPLVAIQSLGEKLMITAQVMYATFLALFFAALILANANFMAIGTGLTQNPMAMAVQFAGNTLYMIILSFMGWCVTTGGMLGIYTPLIPYVIFTMGAIGWFISVMEAMVAAPFVALGILSPSGHHELLGKAEPGLMILFNIFLRPTLMIVGMMAAMLLTPVVVNMVNSGFAAVMGSIDANPGLLELVIFISAYVSLILTVVNKSFSLIHVIPDRVLTWIGGHAGDSSGSEAVGAMKSATGAAAGTAAGAAEGAGKAAQGAGKAAQGGHQAKADAKDAANKHHQVVSGDINAQAPPPKPKE